MNHIHENSWFRWSVLLLALVAGGVMTQVVPSFETVASMREVKPASASQTTDRTRSGVTGVDVDMRHLNYIRSIA